MLVGPDTIGKVSPYAPSIRKPSIWGELSLEDLLENKDHTSVMESLTKEHCNSRVKKSSPGKLTNPKPAATSSSSPSRSKVPESDGKYPKSDFRLADPLRGRYANFDELMSESISIADNKGGTKSPAKPLTKSPAKPTTQSPLNSPNKPPVRSIQENTRAIVQEIQLQKQEKGVKEKRDDKQIHGFFLTEAADDNNDDYDNDFFEQESSPRPEFESQREWGNKSKNTSSSISPNKKSLTIHQIENNKRGPLDDHILSRVRKRLEEATKLEHLVQQNQIMEKGKTERLQNASAKNIQNNPIIRAKKYGAKTLTTDRILPKNQQAQNFRKKAWEDPMLQNGKKFKKFTAVSTSQNTLNISQESNIKERNERNRIRAINSTKNKNVVPNRNDRLRGIKNVPAGARNIPGMSCTVSNSTRRPIESKIIKKDVFLSQLDGRRIRNKNERDIKINQKSTNDNKINRNNYNSGNNLSALPFINERRYGKPETLGRQSRVINTDNKKDEKIEELKNKKLLDLLRKQKEIIERQKNKIARIEIMKKRNQSRSQPNLSHLERVDNINDRPRNVRDLRENRQGDDIKGMKKGYNKSSENLSHLERVDSINDRPRNVRENSLRVEKNKFSSPKKVPQIDTKEGIPNRRRSVDYNAANSSHNIDYGVSNNDYTDRRGFVQKKKSIVNLNTNPNIRSNVIATDQSAPLPGIDINIENTDPNPNPNPNPNKKEKPKVPVVHRQTDEIIDLLSLFEKKETDRSKESKENKDIKENTDNKVNKGNRKEKFSDCENAVSLLMKHAKRLDGHWAKADSFTAQYNSIDKDDHSDDGLNFE